MDAVSRADAFYHADVGADEHITLDLRYFFRPVLGW